MVLAVNGYDEPKEVVEKFVREKKLGQKVLLLGGKVAREKYGVHAYPTCFFIDRTGKVVDREVGFAPNMGKAVEGKIEGLVGKEKRNF